MMERFDAWLRSASNDEIRMLAINLIAGAITVVVVVVYLVGAWVAA